MLSYLFLSFKKIIDFLWPLQGRPRGPQEYAANSKIHKCLHFLLSEIKNKKQILKLDIIKKTNLANYWNLNKNYYTYLPVLYKRSSPCPHPPDYSGIRNIDSTRSSGSVLLAFLDFFFNPLLVSAKKPFEKGSTINMSQNKFVWQAHFVFYLLFSPKKQTSNHPSPFLSDKASI